MSTFFISPLIPLKIYLAIQKEKNNTLLNWTNDELLFLNNINILFDYSNVLSEDNKYIITDIVRKISRNVELYSDLIESLTFVQQPPYREITNYNQYFYNLLIDRNYKQIINPYKHDKIDLSVGISDIGPVSDIKTDKFINLSIDEKDDFIQSLIYNKYTNSTSIKHDILSLSVMSSKINTIIRILANKSILYSLLSNEDFIPYSASFNISFDINAIDQIINNYKINSKSDYFVIKPSSGTLSDGIGIFKKDVLTREFLINWTKDPVNNKYAVSIGELQYYTSWILSDFIQSFLWKLQGPYKTLSKFPSLKPYVENQNLSTQFNDSIGRINKFRFWCLWTIIDGEFTSYLYKDGYCEIALEELTNYSKSQLDPADIEKFYQNLFNVEDDPDEFDRIMRNRSKGISNKTREGLSDSERLEAAHVGTYLDYALVVNETNYPLGKDEWNNTLIPQMYTLTNQLADKCKRYLTCMNKNSKFSKFDNKGCFSYFALDIIVDSNSKPWLLEANSRPFIGFGDYWNQYDKNNEHCINVNDFINTVLGLTVDISNDETYYNKKINYDKFLITTEDKIVNRRKTYIPFSLGISDSATSKVYNEIYNVLDKNKYSAFPYAKFANKNSIGFRGMSPISKYLISQIANLGNDKYLALMKELYPYDAKLKMLNRISTLGFYLGDKSVLTTILKERVKDWDSIIPYSLTINVNETFTDIMNKISYINGTLIAKPSDGQQGKGIIISNNKEQLIYDIKNSEEHGDIWVISKYLDNPYLIKLNKTGVSGVEYNDSIDGGRKCHLRTYVLIKKKLNKMEVYLYRRSLIFCAAKEYGSCDVDDSSYCNLTNLYHSSMYYKNVLGKNPEDAYKDLSGLAVELLPIKDYLLLMNRIKYIIKTSLNAVKNDLICLNEPNYCYQYIAFDFHLEINNGIPEPWLLEINSTPGLKAPEYQWKKDNGLNNFVESLLNIVIDTKISKGNRQLFEYLPYKRKNNKYEDSELINIFKIYENIDDCKNNSYKELKQLVNKLEIKGRSNLNTKDKMCSVLI